MIGIQLGLSLEQKQAALAEVLRSQTFARSDQLKSFLKFVCEKEMAGDGESINEYLIGVEALGRPRSYSPGEDSTVRNRAHLLRNKLLEFYTHENPGQPVRIELPKGSYCPRFIEAEFSVATAPPDMETAPAPAPIAIEPVPAMPRHARSRRWIGVLVLIGLLAVAMSVFVIKRRPARTALDEFWQPVLESPHPVLLCTTQPVLYQLSGEARENLLRRQAAVPAGAAVPYDPLPTETLRGHDVIAIPDQYMGIGTAHATTQLMSLFARQNKPSQLKIGNEASFADLRHTPVVSIGAFGNRWTMTIANHQRFCFEGSSLHHRVIADKFSPEKFWGFTDLPVTGKVSEDYALISRIFQSETGEMLITAAGITQYGTRAAGEFLTQPVYFEQVARQAPAGWQKKNLQIVFSVQVIDHTPGPPTILATHFW